MNEHANTVERDLNRSYQREFWPAMVGYLVVLALSLTLVNADSNSGWNVVWGLTPVIPALFVVRAVHHFLQRADEYVRQIQLTSLAVGFAAAMVAAVTVGFLRVDIPEQLGAWIIFSVGMMSWAAAAAITTTR